MYPSFPSHLLFLVLGNLNSPLISMPFFFLNIILKFYFFILNYLKINIHLFYPHISIKLSVSCLWQNLSTNICNIDFLPILTESPKMDKDRKSGETISHLINFMIIMLPLNNCL
jgi:hypothetical protein